MGWHELELESTALRDNPLGDPATRPVFVWTPPAYETEPERRFPSIYELQGFLGQARAWFNVSPFDRSFPVLVAESGVEAIVVLVDAFTGLGGSQFVDSPAIGAYGTYFCDEVVPFVDERFRTLPEAAHRGIQGRSSGGFGAMVWGMLRPDLFGAFATHAGDALFEVALAADFAAAAQALRNGYGGSWDAFWADFRSGRAVLAGGPDFLLASVYVSAAAYSANADGSVDFPFRPDTGELVPEVWERWRAWDPVRMAAVHGEALRAARGIWIDAGNRDEHFADLAAVAFRNAVAAEGVAAEAVHFELFDGGHRRTNNRLPPALAFLAERLS